MKRLRTTALWAACVLATACPAANYYFRTVDVKDGLVDNYVRDIVRDHEGFIWISTINGLSRYDGLRFHNFMPMDYGARGNDVQAVCATADSTLWMMCIGELFTYRRPEGDWQKDGAARLATLGIKGAARTFHADQQHNLWVETEFGLYHYDYAQRRLTMIPVFNRSPISHIVSGAQTTVIVTSDYNIYKVSLSERRLIPVGKAPVSNHNRDSRVFLDSNMWLWIYNRHDVAGSQWALALNSGKWIQFPKIGDVFINAIGEDSEGNIWAGTENGGIRVFAHQGEQLAQSDNGGMHPFVPHNSHITCFYLDKNNTMWVGSAKLGVAFADMNCLSFNVVSTDPHEDVSALLQNDKGDLWIAFDGGGVIRKTPAGTTTYYTALRQQLPSNIVTSLTTLGDGSILAGTYGSGLARFDGQRFSPLYPGLTALKYVKAMTPDAQGSLWVATVDNGVARVDTQGKMVNYTSQNSSLPSDGVLCLACDSMRNRVYIGTSMGISVFDCAKGQFVEEEALSPLKGTYVNSLMICRHQLLWIGSRNGLWIYRPKEGETDHLTTEQGLSHNNIRSLAMSGSQVWASTDNGLTSIAAEPGSDGRPRYKCRMFFESDGLQDIVFSNDASVMTADGKALLGCFTGYVSIDPDNAIVRYPKLQVQFTHFRINGGTVEAKDYAELDIKYDERPSIYVSAMVPVLSRKVKYFYRFEGEEQWMSVPNGVLYFASLTPGTHILQVKAILPSMMESDIAVLPIHVAAPLWLSRPAIACYLLMLMALAYAVYRILRLRQKREFALRQLEMNLEKYEMEEDKIRFFTNISHDLKTPLTLVVAPLEKIRETNLPAAVRTEVDVAWRNARQLHELVLELLDFRRLDVGMEKLNMKHGDIVGFVRQTVQGFSYYAVRKQINLQMKLPANTVEIPFDENKMRRIITNLLSNAYKYNVDNGSVTVTLDINQELQVGQPTAEVRQMVLSVADTGIGVRNKHHIFDRFVQETHGQEQEGNGLGLHIVKQYVDMMGGTVKVADNVPSGTVFTVTLPVDDTLKPAATEPEDDGPAATTQEETLEENDGKKATTRSVVLVVEDNMDARLFLQRSLADEYDVLAAANGSEALRLLAKSDGVSIVVSDVMMPVMDGIELFRHIKGNIAYSHIPVILLTAKSAERNIIEGLREGVADYITKPFSLEVLRLRIRKVLEWTQQVHDNVAAGIDISPSEITVSSLDEELINNVISHIEAHIADTDYSVAQLSSAVGMTRGHLYKKLMAITNKSPLEFIRIIKLKRGKSLLDQGRTNISEVANMVGLSAKQFAHYFKAMYSTTPSDYLRKRK